MKKLSLLSQSFLLLCLTHLSFSQTANKDIQTLNGTILSAQNITQQITPLLDSAHIPGLSLTIVNHSTIVYSHAFGVKDKTTKAHVTTNTLFEAASLTKPVFAFAVLKLVEEGKISLDKPLHEYLDKPYEGLTDKRYNAITARMVLSHTTGFPNWRDDKLTIGFTPGEKFSYSGEGYVFLQKVVEHITQMPLDKLIQTKVFTPLLMKNSYMVWTSVIQSRVATAYDRSGKSVKGNQSKEANAAYSLYTTAEDYARLLIAILKPAVLQSSSITAMLTPQISLSDAQPALSWGLGWGLEKTSQGIVGFHWGDNPGYKAYTLLVPEKEMALVYFTNSDNGLNIRDRLVDVTLGGKYTLYDWLGYDQYNSPQTLLWETARVKGVQAVLDQYRKFKENAIIKPDENILYKLGYKFYYEKKYPEAIEVFQFNTKEYPSYWKNYVALADTYGNMEKMELCIQNLEKAIELNPDFEQGKQMLKQLKEKK
ncbi:serine hydrolase [Cytophagaceae bacterium YF14B1]|uniref:Serine hydrolase n=1 Tax=Xanthocytophaga flava TaxID=3048013 RepID=A0AAE3QVM8_9BACT|nr:serine hydrolase [Xanthocytophaga flavus]MDJ1483398.1 serine hydrolase [Xanthocytophaga flavus]